MSTLSACCNGWQAPWHDPEKKRKTQETRKIPFTDSADRCIVLPFIHTLDSRRRISWSSFDGQAGMSDSLSNHCLPSSSVVSFVDNESGQKTGEGIRSGMWSLSFVSFVHLATRPGPCRRDGPE